MEHSLPSIRHNISSQRYRYCQLASPSQSGNQQQMPLHAHTRSQLNNRNTSSLGTSTNTFVQYHIQEICLNHNKWLIFDQQKQYANLTSGKSNRPITTAKVSRPNRNKLQTAQYSNTNPLLKSYMNSHKRSNKLSQARTQSINTVLKMGFPENKPLKVSKMQTQRININKVAFKKDKKTKLKTQISESHNTNKLEVPDSRVNRRSPSKSNRSVKSNKTKGQSGQVSSKSPNRPLQSKSIKENINTQKGLLSQMQQVSSKSFVIYNCLQAELVDPIELLSPTYQVPIMYNPYEDFPEWNHPNSTNEKIIQPFPVKKDQPFAGQQEYLRKNTLDDSMMMLSQRPTTKRDSKKKGDSIAKSFASPNHSNLKVQFNEKMVHSEQGQRYITTNQSYLLEKRYLNSPQMSCMKESQQDYNSSVNSGVKHTLRDTQFVIEQQFKPEEQITFIQISKTSQTSYFPANLKQIYYIRPNPNSQSVYQNSQMIKILNLFLKVQSETIKNIFVMEKERFYSCLLYHDNIPKIVSVQGLFPFDSNLYPLFGEVEQYIWFSVLVKAIAKLYQSYSRIPELTFKQIFKLLTNCDLNDIQANLKSESEPVQFLASTLKAAAVKGMFGFTQIDGKYYKIGKLLNKKSIFQRRQKSQTQGPSSTMNLKGKERSFPNMQSLNKFISKRKEQISKERTSSNTYVQLVGTEESRKMGLKELISGDYSVWIPVAVHTLSQNNE